MFEQRSNIVPFCRFVAATCLALLAGCAGHADVAASGPNSDPSTPVTSVTAPVAPASLKAMPGNAQASLTWTASTGATSYNVKRSTTSGGPYAQLVSATSPSYTDAKVTNGATYYYVVTAVNAMGESNDSPQASVTPDPTITIPSIPAGVAATAGNAQVSLTWSASSGAVSYHVKRATASGGPYTQVAAPTSAAYSDTSVTNGTTYYYVVSALNSAGESANSPQVSALPSAPSAPTVKSIAINPTTAAVPFGGTFQFSAVLTGMPGSSTLWSMQETGNVGAITSGGRYTAPSVAGTFHVVAKSSTDSSITSTASVTVTAPQGTFPALTPGVWKDITPPAPGLAQTYGAAFLKVSPVDPSVIYVLIDTLGIWRTTDRGSNWTRLGTPTTYNYGPTATYLDSPVRLEVDPSDATHLIATQGVRGMTLGFWVSHDAGATWTMPQGFINATKTATNDVTSMVVDPTNFNHILLGSHSPWGPVGSTQRPAGIMESTDGGNTWILHEAVSSWPAGSLGINFLYDPRTGQGDSNTWLVGTDGNGFWRTTDAGSHWTSVTSFSVTHGGAQLYYAQDGTLYSGANGLPVRSHDNGLTWEQVGGGLPNFYYYSVVGDGVTLYTQLSNTGDNAGQGPQPYMTASEATGNSWTPYQGGAQTFNDGPYVMNYDAANGIMYSANWRTGIWALKVIKP